MAEVITRFRIETTQWDSKLRDAAKNLSDLTHQLGMAGKDFDRFAKDHVKAAQSLATVESGATNLKDKLKDLVGAYNKVATAYNAMTKEQQGGEFGKAMAASLQTLQGRISETKKQLNELGGESGKTGGILEQLKSKVAINVDAMKLLDLGIKAVNGALDVAKDAFFKNEENLDEWGRTVASCESIYSGFLSALNTGDISGFLQNIGEIEKAARNAYDALDALSTFNAFNQINVEKTRTGMTESIASYREGNADKETVRASGEAYKKELSERKRLEKDAYLAAVELAAKDHKISTEDLLDALSGSYGHYQDLKNVQPTGERIKFVGGGTFGMTQMITEKFAQNREEELGQALRQLNDTELRDLQALGAQAERTANEIASVDKQLTRVLNGRQGGTGGGGGTGGKTIKSEVVNAAGSIADLNAQMSELKKLQDQATNANQWRDYQQAIDVLKIKVKELKNEVGFLAGRGDKGESITAVSGMGSDWVKNRQDQLKNGKLDFTDVNKKIASLKDGGTDVAAAWQQATNAVNSVGSALAGLDDPAAKIMGTIGMAIANIASGFAQASAQEGKGGVWYWIAATAAGLATMVSTIQSIHSATGYAEGGMVKGTTYSNDQIPAMLNAGELVLNQSQQGIIASALQGNRQQATNEKPYVSGEMIFLALNNYMKRAGYGELMRAK